MTPFGDNPFAVLTTVAAPAVLTNTCSVLCLGTSNRGPLGAEADRRGSGGRHGLGIQRLGSRLAHFFRYDTV
jgi:hypothetical protein